jgi:hypothetical protein
MDEHSPSSQGTYGSPAVCLEQAASFLAACARPAVSIGADATPAQLSSALTELVTAAELFGCKPSFWHWAAEAATLLGRGADADTFRKRFNGAV